ncbi:MAG: acyl-CoA desaturase [Candidatus Omnitrophica bacterium]|nr:acyl-CoA desaturase [Candidatus Omnitrophota bacterium]
MTSQTSVRKIVWLNLVFFSLTAVLGFIGGPIYVARNGISFFEIALTLFYMAATGLSITAGYHRLFSHATYKAHPALQFLFLFFGAAAFEQSALDWSAQHRDHHRFVDTERDPYSIQKGFFYAHIGWLIFWKHRVPYENVRDLEKNAMIRHQHQKYHLWAIGSGIVVPVLIGALAGHALGAFLLAFCFRTAFIHHATFCINSVCHMFGTATYDVHASAKDHWFVAYLTNGEGYHNFHHRFPSDYRNGIRWYHWDPSKWLIASLAKAGLAWDLKKVSNFRIWEARLMAENQRVSEQINQPGKTRCAEELAARLQEQYRRLASVLRSWESVSREHQLMFAEKLKPSAQIVENAIARIQEARKAFILERSRWLKMVRSSIRPAALS